VHKLHADSSSRLALDSETLLLILLRCKRLTETTGIGMPLTTARACFVCIHDAIPGIASLRGQR
jgi:hypothetical protein